MTIWKGSMATLIIDLFGRSVDVSGALRTISPSHYHAHSGTLFSIDTTTPGFDALIANNASLYLTIQADEGNYPHLAFTIKLEGKGRLLVYELENDAAITGGTEVAVANKKWRSETGFGGTALRNPTVSLVNAIFKEGCIIQGAEGVAHKFSGSQASFDEEVIITPGKPFCLQVLNESGGTVRGCICALAYNSIA